MNAAGAAGIGKPTLSRRKKTFMAPDSEMMAASWSLLSLPGIV